MKKLPDNTFDGVVTSPPYDDMRSYNGYAFDYKEVGHQLFRTLKEGRNLVWVVNDQTKGFCESLTSFKTAIYFVEECGFKLLDTMIYNKNTGATIDAEKSKRYLSRFEYMFVFTKGKPTIFNPITQKKKDSSIARKSLSIANRKADGSLVRRKVNNKGFGDYVVKSNVWDFSVGYGQAYFTWERDIINHPAIFPYPLAVDHITSWTNEGDLVYDPFMGSGTTACACVDNNREFVGTDMSSTYIKESYERIEAHKKHFRKVKRRLF